MKKLVPFVICFILCLATSCTGRKNINYLQNIDSVVLSTAKQNNTSVLETSDQLQIFVSAKDMTVVAPFNQNYVSTTTPNLSVATSNIQSSQSSSLPTYQIDSSGDILFPVIGTVHARGKTIEALREELIQDLKKYIINPTVSVRRINFKVTVLGEVSRPGTYVVSDGDATVFSALGLAGDTTVYGERTNVILVRESDGKIEQTKIDLTDANLFNSPYFHLKQNDYLVVGANKTKQKSSRIDPNTGLYISVASIVVTILALVIK